MQSFQQMTLVGLNQSGPHLLCGKSAEAALSSSTLLKGLLFLPHQGKTQARTLER
jgi:hypothetical protein